MKRYRGPVFLHLGYSIININFLLAPKKANDDIVKFRRQKLADAADEATTSEV